MAGKGLGYSKKKKGTGEEDANKLGAVKVPGQFAERYLEKLGWKKGTGLGKKKHGIKRAIQVSLKSDKRGLGTTTDYSVEWWDNIFDKASAAINVDKDDDGQVVINRTSKEEEKQIGKELLYGCFVKANEIYVSSLQVTDNPAN